MKRLLIWVGLCLGFFGTPVKAQHTIYSQADSIQVVRLLKEAQKNKEKNVSWMLYFGRKLQGVPYVGGVLDDGEQENLIINLRQLDCTTFVEQVLALSQCASHHKYSWNDFLSYMRNIRYIDGQISYVKRQHYFTTWINDNVIQGLVKDVQGPVPPFSSKQTIHVNYMTTHISLYKMLKAHPAWVHGIQTMENDINGKVYRYIPKEKISNTSLLRRTVHDGDILVMITNKKGLDTSHIGIASWHKDGLHMLNASSVHKKVIEEPMTLFKYMQKHPSQIGVRVVRPLYK